MRLVLFVLIILFVLATRPSRSRDGRSWWDDC